VNVAIPSLERQSEILTTSSNVIVATIRRDGSPQLSPTWFLWTGTVFWISAAAATVKVRNLRRDPRIALCVDVEASGDYVQITGSATLIEGDSVRDPTLALCRKYMAPEAVDTHWASLVASGPQVIIEVRPDHFQWHDH
jgi:PPOX class probable F420-dependent enzyme